MIDISSKREGPAGKLSNFTSRFFLFDSVPCACLEGPIQAFKFKDIEEQKEICMLPGREAKKRGQQRNEIWQSSQTLWWMGEEYPRESDKYQKLLDRLYDVLAHDPNFQNDLLSTGDEILTHSIGEKDPQKTVLTEEEFCSRLMRLRKILKEK